jgi:hypothetical protein
MTASRFFLYSLLLTAALVCLDLRLDAQAPKTSVPFNLEEVIKLVHTGLSDELIITKIKKNGKAFDLNADELVELKKVGVSDNVIKYLLDPAQPYAPPPPLPPPGGDPSGPGKPNTPPKEYPADDHAARVPMDPGLYRFPEEALTKFDLKMMMGKKEGAGVGKFLMQKGKLIGYLVAPASKTRIKEATPTYYLRLPDGKGIEEVVLVALEQKGKQRELEMGPGPKEEIKANSMRPFDSLEVGLRLFKITPAKLTKGEYMFYLIGSAEPPKGNYGKGYEFGIDDVPAGKKSH